MPFRLFGTMSFFWLEKVLFFSFFRNEAKLSQLEKSDQTNRSENCFISCLCNDSKSNKSNWNCHHLDALGTNKFSCLVQSTYLWSKKMWQKIIILTCERSYYAAIQLIQTGLWWSSSLEHYSFVLVMLKVEGLNMGHPETFFRFCMLWTRTN